MPARSTVSNRTKLRKAREEMKALPREQRDQLRYNGIGPGDGYVGMWRMLNRDRRRLEGVEGRMTAIKSRLDDKGLSGQGRADLRLELSALEEKDDLLSQRILATYGRLLPHEKPRLQSVEVKNDPTGPLYHEVDLSRLSREDLLALARILPKLGGAPSEPAPPEPKRVGRT
jgi:hypothetical protein